MDNSLGSPAVSFGGMDGRPKLIEEYAYNAAVNHFNELQARNQVLVNELIQRNREKEATDAELLRLREENDKSKRAVDSYESYLHSQAFKLELEALKTEAHESAQFENFEFAVNSYCQPLILKSNPRGKQTARLFSASSHFEVNRIVVADDDERRIVVVSYISPGGDCRQFAFPLERITTDCFNSFVRSGGSVCYLKDHSSANYLFSRFIAEKIADAPTEYVADSATWFKGREGWIASIAKGCSEPLLTTDMESSTGLILDLFRIYGFLAPRLPYALRIKKLVNLVDTANVIEQTIALDAREKEIVRCLSKANPPLLYVRLEAVGELTYYNKARINTNLAALRSICMKPGRALPVLVTNRLFPESSNCVQFEYSDSCNHLPSAETLGELADLIAKYPGNTDQIFQKYLENKAEESTSESVSCAFRAIIDILHWFFSSRGNIDKAEQIKSKCIAALKNYLVRLEHSSDNNVLGLVRQVLRKSVESGELKLVDLLSTPLGTDLKSVALYDEGNFYISSHRLKEIVNQHLPQFTFSQVINALVISGSLVKQGGEETTARLYVRFDSGDFAQQRYLFIRKAFLDRGSIQIQKLARYKS